MGENTLGKDLVQEALGDSYYPDLGQSVNAERMIEVIDRYPILSAAPLLLELLKEFVSVPMNPDAIDELAERVKPVLASIEEDTP